MKNNKVPAPKGMMKSTMPSKADQGGKLPSGDSNYTASISGLTAYAKGGSVKMPTSMPRKSACK